MVKNKATNLDFDMKFDTYTDEVLVELCSNSHQLSYMDRDDLYSLLHELAERVQRKYEAMASTKTAAK